MQLIRLFGALAVLTSVTSCGDLPDVQLPAALQSYPPDRSSWDALPVGAQAAHARALHSVLMSPGTKSATWSADGASGRVHVLATKEGEQTLCRGFSDRLAAQTGNAEIRDIACWSDAWIYPRGETGLPVLAPAFAQEDRVYTVRSGGTLKAVARRKRVKLVELEFLNPGLPDRLPRGTKVLLP